MRKLRKLFDVFGGNSVEVEHLRCFSCNGFLRATSAPMLVNVKLGKRKMEGPLDELGNRQELVVSDLALNNLELNCNNLSISLRGKGIEICQACTKKLLESEPCV